MPTLDEYLKHKRFNIETGTNREVQQWIRDNPRMNMFKKKLKLMKKQSTLTQSLGLKAKKSGVAGSKIKSVLKIKKPKKKKKKKKTSSKKSSRSKPKFKKKKKTNTKKMRKDDTVLIDNEDDDDGGLEALSRLVNEVEDEDDHAGGGDELDQHGRTGVKHEQPGATGADDQDGRIHASGSGGDDEPAGSTGHGADGEHISDDFGDDNGANNGDNADDDEPDGYENEQHPSDPDYVPTDGDDDCELEYEFRCRWHDHICIMFSEDWKSWDLRVQCLTNERRFGKINEFINEMRNDESFRQWIVAGWRNTGWARRRTLRRFALTRGCGLKRRRLTKLTVQVNQWSQKFYNVAKENYIQEHGDGLVRRSSGRKSKKSKKMKMKKQRREKIFDEDLYIDNKEEDDDDDEDELYDMQANVHAGRRNRIQTRIMTVKRSRSVVGDRVRSPTSNLFRTPVRSRKRDYVDMTKDEDEESDGKEGNVDGYDVGPDEKTKGGLLHFDHPTGFNRHCGQPYETVREDLEVLQPAFAAYLGNPKIKSKLIKPAQIIQLGAALWWMAKLSSNTLWRSKEFSWWMSWRSSPSLRFWVSKQRKGYYICNRELYPRVPEIDRLLTPTERKRKKLMALKKQLGEN